MPRAFLALALALDNTAAAEVLPGADDPAFQSSLTTLLSDDRATAEGLDACYAKVLALRDTIDLGP